MITEFQMGPASWKPRLQYQGARAESTEPCQEQKKGKPHQCDRQKQARVAPKICQAKTPWRAALQQWGQRVPVHTRIKNKQNLVPPAVSFQNPPLVKLTALWQRREIYRFNGAKRQQNCLDTKVSNLCAAPSVSTHTLEFAVFVHLRVAVQALRS